MAQTKTKSPIALINELTISCQESYDSWKCIYNGGGSDPFWADGVNLNLVRNHIIYYKRQMQEISEEYGCFLPEVYYREVPPKVESDYMAETDKILEDALKVKEIFRENADYQKLLSYADKLTDEQEKAVCYDTVMNYAKCLERAVDSKNFIDMRRYSNYTAYLKAFTDCLAKIEKLFEKERIHG